MQTFRSLGHTLRATAAAAALLATAGIASASAAELAQGAAAMVALDANSTALTYWIEDGQGFRVVTTVNTIHPGNVAMGEEDRHTIVRFSTLLAPGQAQTISVPGEYGRPSSEFHVRRIGDRVEMSTSTGGWQQVMRQGG
jgi:hypothetical protein